MAKNYIEKKRELLPLLKDAICSLSMMSGDVADLEYKDNDKVSRKLKKDIVDFKTGPLERLTQAIYKTREEIKQK